MERGGLYGGSEEESGEETPAGSPLTAFYKNLEGKYYALCDWLEEKGLRVYDFFVNPLEDRGIPSFPVSVLLLLLLLLGVFSLFMQPSQNVELTVLVKSNGTNVNNAIVELLRNDDVLFSQDTLNSGAVVFSGLQSAKYEVKVSKTGYADASEIIDVSKQTLLVIDLKCSTGSCAGNETPSVPVAPPRTPGVPEEDDDGSYFSDSPTGRLSIFTKDANGSFILNSTVKIFEADSNVEIATLNLPSGYASFDELEAGTRVFLRAFAQGYLSYTGSQTWVIEPGINNAELVLTKLSSEDDPDPNFQKSWVFVKNELNSPVEGAGVDVFQNDYTGAPISYGLFTNASGVVSVSLPLTGDFYAKASKTGFFDNSSELFESGENATILLSASTLENSASLAVTVLDEFNLGVLDAIVELSRIENGLVLPIGDTIWTDDLGQALFEGLPAGVTVTANVSSGNQIGTGSITLANGENSLEVSLLLRTAFLNASAYNGVTGELIPSVFFEASFGNNVSSCDAEPYCILPIPAGSVVNVTASAMGFESLTKSARVNMPNSVEDFQTWLLPTDYVKNSYLVFEGLFDSQGRKVFDPITNTGSVFPGKTYEARFVLTSKNADLSGLNIEVMPDQAWFSSYFPPAPVGRAKASEISSWLDGCVSNENFEQSTPYAWTDLTYSGSLNMEITFNLTINPTIALDPQSFSADVSLFYRSFIKRGTSWIRNPFDERFNTTEGAPLSSGCSAFSKEEIIRVYSPQTSCTEFGCVTMEFWQGTRSGTQNFEAKVFDPSVPVIVYYQVDLFQPLARDSASLVFSQGASLLKATSVTTPLKREGNAWLCESNAVTYDLDAFSFEKNLDPMSECTNYAPDLPFSFSGVITLEPQSVEGEPNTKLTLTLFSGSKNASHSANVLVTGASAPSSDFKFDTISQVHNDVLKIAEWPRTQELPPLQAYTLDGCDAECAYGDVFVNFSLPVSMDVPEAFFNLQLTPVHFQFIAGTAKITHSDLSPADELYFTSSGTPQFDAITGDVITGSLQLKPLAVTDSTQATLYFESNQAEQIGFANVSATATFAIGFRKAQPSDPEQDTIDFLNAGGCQVIGLEEGSTGLSVQCPDVVMRVSPILPVDGIQVTINNEGTLLEGIVSEEPAGTSSCFQTCDYNPVSGDVSACVQGFKALNTKGTRILRFNPFASSNCPLKPYGNTVLGGYAEPYVKRKISSNSLQQDVEITIKLKGQSYEQAGSGLSGLYVAPLTNGVLDGQQYTNGLTLWAVVNNQQLGRRDVFVNPKMFSFDEPGVQVFSYPTGSTPVVTERSMDISWDVVQQNQPRTITAVQQELGNVPVLANATVYWRGTKDQTWWCQDEGSLAGECRPTLDSWKKIRYYYEPITTPCVFCNNRQGTPCSGEPLTYYPTCYNAPAGANNRYCDSRCLPIDIEAVDRGIAEDGGNPIELFLKEHYEDAINPWIGYAAINYTETFGSKTCSTPVKGTSRTSEANFFACKNAGLCPSKLISGRYYPYCFDDDDGNGWYEQGEPYTEAQFSNGEYYCSNVNWKLGVIKRCLFQCKQATAGDQTGWCGPVQSIAERLGVPVSCDISCPARGYYEERGNPKSEETGWYNTSNVVEKSASLTPIALAPFAYFKDLRDSVKFEFHSPADSQGSSNLVRSNLNLGAILFDVSDCSAGAYSMEAFYDFNYYVEEFYDKIFPQWKVKGSVLTLNKNNYLDSSSACKKDKDVLLCHPVYTDYSQLRGTCFNSISSIPSLSDKWFYRAPLLSAEIGSYQVDSEGYVSKAESLGTKSEGDSSSFSWWSPALDQYQSNTLVISWVRGWEAPLWSSTASSGTKNSDGSTRIFASRAGEWIVKPSNWGGN